MNFLSHYYLQNKNNNFYFNIGITLPDILSMHNSKIILGKININNAIDTSNDVDQINLLKGMYAHAEADKNFHSSEFFAQGLLKLNTVSEKIKISKISEPIRHILLEILLDRYLLLKDKNIADSFYSDYSSLNTDLVSNHLTQFKNFDRNLFSEFVIRFIYLKFIYHYESFEGICDILFRLAGKYNLKINAPPIKLSEFIENSYNSLFDKIHKFFEKEI